MLIYDKYILKEITNFLNTNEYNNLYKVSKQFNYFNFKYHLILQLGRICIFPENTYFSNKMLINNFFGVINNITIDYNYIKLLNSIFDTILNNKRKIGIISIKVHGINRNPKLRLKSTKKLYEKKIRVKHGIKYFIYRLNMGSYYRLKRNKNYKILALIY